MTMMSREYMCLDGIGDEHKCREIFLSAQQELLKLNQSSVFSASKLQIYQDEGDLFVDGIDLEDLNSLENQNPPLIWLNITFDSQSYDKFQIEGFIRKFGFQKIFG